MKTSSSLAVFAVIGAFLQAACDTTVVTKLNNSDILLNITGHYGPETKYTFQPVAFDVPEGCTSIHVLQKYSDKGNGSSIDIGLWNPRGTDIYDGRNQSHGFVGWSGGARTNFTISAKNGTDGYVPQSTIPGTWYVMQGPYTVRPEGVNWEIDVTLGFEPIDGFYQPNYAPHRVGPDPDNAEGQWYRGDCHLHTMFSDGGHTPAEVVALSQEANLKFMITSEHNTNAANLYYGVVAPSDILVIEAIEVTTRAGHWQAIGMDPYDWVDFRYQPGATPGLEEAKKQVQLKEGGFASINHPYVDQGNCAACNWTHPDMNFDGFEIWNGWWDRTDEITISSWQEQLVLGNMLIGIGGSDFHNPPDHPGFPTTKVKATSLSKNGILSGLHARRVIVLQGPSYDLGICVRGSEGICYDVGDEVKGSGPYEIQIETSNMNGSVASVWTQNGKLYEAPVPTLGYTVNYTLPAGQKWVRVEVRNSTSMLAMTNLVFLPEDQN